MINDSQISQNITKSSIILSFSFSLFMSTLHIKLFSMENRLFYFLITNNVVQFLKNHFTSCF